MTQQILPVFHVTNNYSHSSLDVEVNKTLILNSESKLNSEQPST